MADLLRWALGGALLLVSAWVCALNASVLWIYYVRKRKAPSSIPLVGGVSGAVGLWLLPISAAHRWWWVPLVFDWGSLPLFMMVAYCIIIRWHQGRTRDTTT